MPSFKTNIPKSLLIAGFNQVNNYLIASNHMLDLKPILPSEFGAEAMFGGEGDWDPVVDTPLLNAKLTKLADEVSIQQFRINKKQAALHYGDLKIEDPSDMTGSLFGFDLLFEEAAPELL